MATSSLPLNFTSVLPLIYRGSAVVLPWHKGNLMYVWETLNPAKIQVSENGTNKLKPSLHMICACDNDPYILLHCKTIIQMA